MFWAPETSYIEKIRQLKEHSHEGQFTLLLQFG